MPHPLLIFRQSDHLILIFAINSHTKWQTVQIQISWLLQKPTDLDLYCFQRQGLSGFSRTRVNIIFSHCVCGQLWNVPVAKLPISDHVGLGFNPTGGLPVFQLWLYHVWLVLLMFLLRNKKTGEGLLMSINNILGVVGWCEGVVYLASPGRPTDIVLQLDKACYPCGR